MNELDSATEERLRGTLWAPFVAELPALPEA